MTRDRTPEMMVGHPRAQRPQDSASEAALVTERMLRTMPSIVYVFDVRQRRTLFVSPNVQELLGFTPGELETEGGGLLEGFLHPEELAGFDQVVARWRRAADGEIQASEFRLRDREGRWRWFLGRHSVFSRDRDGLVRRVIGTATDIGDRRAAEDALRDREARLVRLNRVLKTLGDVNRVILRETEPVRLLRQACDILAREPFYALVWSALVEPDGSSARLVAASTAVEAERFRVDLEPGQPHPGFVARAILDRRVVRVDEHSLPADTPEGQLIAHDQSIRSTLALPLLRGGRCLGALVVHARESDVVDEEETTLLADLAANLGYALAHLESEAERRRHHDELALLSELTRIALEADDLDALAAGLVDRLATSLGASCCCLALWDVASRRVQTSAVFQGNGCCGWQPSEVQRLADAVIDEGAPLIRLEPGTVTCDGCGMAFGLPIRAFGRPLGVLFVAMAAGSAWSDLQASRAEQAANQVALAVAKAQLVETNRRRVAALLALHETGVDLGAELELEPLLQAIVDRAERLAGAPMGGLYLLEAREGDGLRMAMAHGSLEPFVGCLLPRGQGVSGRVVETLEPLLVQDYHQWENRSPMFADLEVGSVIAAPIRWRGTTLGVLHVEHPEPNRFTADEVEVVTLLAEQAAAAIANTRLFSDLERARSEIESAYDATLEGWVRALDLRDKETEGHTQRVTEMTLRLARKVGIPETELVHVRRGVLLHDLGKIGIPDQILLKRGPLEPHETEVMRRHPRLAHEMLAPIDYLRPALEVPFCHHERWDGSGYPRGLKGEEIPLAARLFSVVDVWDALSFDRSYREAWPEDRVRAYIADSAGTLFDPWVVEAFFELLAEGESNAADDPPVG